MPEGSRKEERDRNASRTALAAGLALAVLVVGAYARVAGNGFINLDDNDYVTQNPRVQAGLTWKGLAWALTTGHSANWHPLTWLSHMLDCQLYDMSPVGPHLTNLALHLASTLLLFRLFVLATGSIGASAFVASAFGLHPLHVESVAWIAERKDVLSALLWILTMLAYVGWVRRPSPGKYLAVVGLYALGLLAKPMLVTLPFALLLFDLWPLRRIPDSRGRARAVGRLVVEKIPLFVLAAASSAVTFLVQRAAGAMSLGDRIPFGLRAENALVSYAAYLWKCVAPVRLAVYYPHPVEAYPAARVAAAGLAIAAASVFALRCARRRPWIAVGWLWFLGTLVPVIGLVQVGSQAMADRYTYLPMIGLSMAAGFEAAELAGRSRPLRAATAAAFALAVALWTGLSWRQAGFWKDDRSLFGHVADVMPENHLAQGILGNVYLHERRFDDALARYREALRLRPDYAQARSNMGMAFELTGRVPEAMAEYEAALKQAPNLAEAHHNLGRLLAARGELAAATQHFEAALRSNPDFVEAHYNYGVLLLKTNRVDEAIEQFRKALDLRPDYEDARRMLGKAESSRPAARLDR